jgi:alpha-1,3-mannosyl-glycoprotein beta-1,2-N-acetylglucosaminyltransferase
MRLWKRTTSGVPPPRRRRRGGREERLAIGLLLTLAVVWGTVLVGTLVALVASPTKSVPTFPTVPTDSRPSAAFVVSDAPGAYESPLLVFTCRRDQYLRETLRDIWNYIPTDCSVGCPLVISQDGNDPAVRRVVREFTDEFATKNVPVIHWTHTSALRGSTNGYQALAIHYGWALRRVFDGQTLSGSVHGAKHGTPQRVIILEEDLHVAPDFFDYFAATAPLLDHDSSLLAVSAFHDNGFAHNVRNASRILRSDFFPGLGWMMNRRLWVDELQSKWPGGYWDDWLREPAQRQDRAILRPEISRTYHFGTEGGTSSNQFGSHLSKILLNRETVDWSKAVDLEAQLRPEVYDPAYWSMVQASTLTYTIPDALEQAKKSNARLQYTTIEQFKYLAHKLKLMADEKANVPRTAYKGIVETRPHGADNFLFLTPPLAELQKEFDIPSPKR